MRKVEAISASTAELIMLERIFERARMIPLGKMGGEGGRFGFCDRGPRK